jgi:hypothetical protein
MDTATNIILHNYFAIGALRVLFLVMIVSYLPGKNKNDLFGDQGFKHDQRWIIEYIFVGGVAVGWLIGSKLWSLEAAHYPCLVNVSFGPLI